MEKSFVYQTKNKEHQKWFLKEKYMIFSHLNLVNIQCTLKQIITVFIRFIIPVKINV